MTPPDLDRTSALFLDVDGTLVEIAATPEAVVVAPGLPGLLAQLHGLLDGAVAIVSGRPLSQIDELLHPFAGSAAGEHGVAIRFGDGTLGASRGGNGGLGGRRRAAATAPRRLGRRDGNAADGGGTARAAHRLCPAGAVSGEPERHNRRRGGKARAG